MKKSYKSEMDLALFITITGGFGNFFCKSITITHGIHNIPVIFVNPGGDYNESYFIIKGQTVVTGNEQYTFLDFDATEPDFTVDIDLARITLTSAGLEYGFFQSIIETTKACVIWRNALVRNEGVVANVFDYSSSFALSEHICVNLKVYNSVDDGNGYNYSSEAPNLYNLYIHSCWYEVPNVVFRLVGSTEGPTSYGCIRQCWCDEMAEQQEFIANDCGHVPSFAWMEADLQTALTALGMEVVP